MSDAEKAGGLIYAPASDTRRAEEALQQSERRYRQLLAAVTAYNYQVKVENGVPVSTEHSRGCLSATGYAPEDYAADPYLWFGMVYADDRELVQRHVARALAGEDVPPLEHRIMHRDGSTRWLRNTIILHRDSDGRLVHFDGVVEDITERKRAEGWFRTALELAPDPIVITDSTGKIVLCNAQTESVFGYRGEELLGQSVELLVPDRLRQVHAAHRASYHEDPKVRSMGTRPDLPARRKDGTEFLVEISLGPIRTESDVLIFAVIRDVTERRRLEKALRANEVQLLAARRIQEHFLPRCAPEISGFDIAGACYPAEFTAGDHFDYIPMPGGTLGIVVADVSGHGYGPALLTVALRNHLRALVGHHDTLEEILGDANRLLSEEMEQGNFITLLMGRLDPQARTFHYVNAGHPSGFLLDASGRLKASLDSANLPLGIMPELSFAPAASLALGPGDLLVLLTDGVLEVQTAAGELFGTERTLETIRANRHLPAREIIEALYRTVREFSGSKKIADDVTVVVIKTLETA